MSSTAHGSPPFGDLRVLLVVPEGSDAARQLTATAAETRVVPDRHAAARRADGETDCLGVVHDPPAADARAVVESVRATAPDLPAVAAVPSTDPPALPADDRTDYVRRVDDWPTDLVRRAARLASGDDDGAAAGHAPGATRGREAMVEGFTDGFYALDEEWQFVAMDEHAAAVLGLDPETARGRSLWAVFPEARDTVWETEFRAAAETGRPRSFETYVKQLGAWFEVYVYPDGDGVAVYFRDVTDRRSREAELEAYEQLFENVREKLFVVDGDCRFELVTAPLAAWLGRDRDRLEGVPVAEVLTDEALDRADELLERNDRAAETLTFETEVRTGDGEPATASVELTALPHGDGVGRVVGAVRDVTDRRARERRHNALVDNVPGMVYRRVVEEPDAATVPLMDFATESYGELTGRAAGPGAPAGDDWLPNVVHPADRERVARLVQEAATTGEPYTATYRITTPDGCRWVQDRARPVRGPDGSIVALEGLVIDVTDRRQRHRHHQVLNRVLRHDLRNGVQVVRGFATEIEDRAADGDLDPAAVEEMAARVVGRSDQLAGLSERAREIERVLDAGVDELATVDAASICREVVARHDGAATVDTPEAAPVRANPQLRRAVAELVENAVTHGAPPVRVTVTDCEREGWTVVRVADDGSGLPERERAVLSGEEITQLVHGQGLGLWLVKWLVESYGGEVRFDVTDGTTVSLLLRRSEPTASDRETARG